MNQVETGIRSAGASWRRGEETPDEVVLERVRAGETELYEVLVHRYNPRVRYVVRRVLSNEADVADVMQDMHYNAFRHIRQFSGRSSFATWLTRIAIHAALSRLRRRAYPYESGSSVDEPLRTAASALRDPEQQMQDKEMRDALKTAVQALPKRCRTVLLLRRLKELSTTEVAVLLDISTACAKTRLYRAQVLLRHRLQAAAAPFGGANAIGESVAARHNKAFTLKRS